MWGFGYKPLPFMTNYFTFASHVVGYMIIIITCIVKN